MSIKFLDCDRHVAEPINMWKDYLPESLHEYLPYLVEDTLEACAARTVKYNLDNSFLLMPEVFVNGKPLYKNWSEIARLDAYLHKSQFKENDYRAFTGEQQILSMDEGSVESAYLFPSLALCLINNDEFPIEVNVAYARAYNQWLRDYCRFDPDRLKAIGAICRHNPVAMMDELEHIIENGWTSVTIRPEVIAGRDVGHSDYDEFWRQCEANNIAVAFHGSTHLHGSTAGSERFKSRFALHACSHPMEAQMAFLSLLESGVFERFPSLKFGFFEAGASWLASWLWRLDEVCYATMPLELKQRVKLTPSAYFKRQCWVGFEPGEPGLKQLADIIGIDKLLYGTDYPHPDHLQFDLGEFQHESGFSESDIESILLSNPRKFFGS